MCEKMEKWKVLKVLFKKNLIYLMIMMYILYMHLLFYYYTCNLRLSVFHYAFLLQTRFTNND